MFKKLKKEQIEDLVDTVGELFAGVLILCTSGLSIYYYFETIPTYERGFCESIVMAFFLSIFALLGMFSIFESIKRMQNFSKRKEK